MAKSIQQQIAEMLGIKPDFQVGSFQGQPFPLLWKANSVMAAANGIIWRARIEQTGTAVPKIQEFTGAVNPFEFTDDAGSFLTPKFSRDAAGSYRIKFWNVSVPGLTQNTWLPVVIRIYSKDGTTYRRCSTTSYANYQHSAGTMEITFNVKDKLTEGVGTLVDDWYGAVEILYQESVPTDAASIVPVQKIREWFNVRSAAQSLTGSFFGNPYPSYPEIVKTFQALNGTLLQGYIVRATVGQSLGTPEIDESKVPLVLPWGGSINDVELTAGAQSGDIVLNLNNLDIPDFLTGNEKIYQNVFVAENDPATDRFYIHKTAERSYTFSSKIATTTVRVVDGTMADASDATIFIQVIAGGSMSPYGELSLLSEPSDVDRWYRDGNVWNKPANKYPYHFFMGGLGWGGGTVSIHPNIQSEYPPTAKQMYAPFCAGLGLLYAGGFDVDANSEVPVTVSADIGVSGCLPNPDAMELIGQEVWLKWTNIDLPPTAGFPIGGLFFDAYAGDTYESDAYCPFINGSYDPIKREIALNLRCRNQNGANVGVFFLTFKMYSQHLV